MEWLVGFKVVARNLAIPELTHELGCYVPPLPVDHSLLFACHDRWRNPELMSAMGGKRTISKHAASRNYRVIARFAISLPGMPPLVANAT
jgi:hypothetical protein